MGKTGLFEGAEEMSRLKTFLYSTNTDFNLSEADRWTETFFATYIEAAQRIAKHLDDQYKTPPVCHYFWLLEEGHEKPQKIKVVSELVREYHAQIVGSFLE